MGYLKSLLVENAPLGGSTTPIKFAYKNIKDYSVKLLLCRLYKYKNAIHVIMDTHCVYQNSTYLLAHEQIRLLSGDAFSLCALKFCHTEIKRYEPLFHKRKRTHSLLIQSSLFLFICHSNVIYYI